MKLLLIFLMITQLLSCSKTELKVQKEIDYLEGISTKISNVDIVFIYGPHSRVQLSDFLKELAVAKEIFKKLKVNLHLKKIREISFPQKWHKVSVMDVEGKACEKSTDFYRCMEIKKFSLSQNAKNIFEALIPLDRNSSRTIYVLGLNEVEMSYFEKGKVKKLVVGALSFPGYIFGKRIPENFRGVITTRNKSRPYRTLAHELGHKLFNVSHEGLSVCPQFSGEKIPGLMGYSDDIKVYGGKLGRWHVERLLKSPFLYRFKNGEKYWNQDYLDHGIYHDKIYGKYIVEPACRKK